MKPFALLLLGWPIVAMAAADTGALTSVTP